jgi:tetratricopeptide (TPR) repeat protein
VSLPVTGVTRWHLRAHTPRQVGSFAHIAHIALIALLAFVARPCAFPLQAQSLPERPELAKNADPNDWSAYFDKGVEVFRSKPEVAEAAFYWASRINPERAEALFARWVAFHNRDQRRFMAYLDGKPKIMADSAVLAADSLRLLAMVRNPFVHRGLEVALYDQFPGKWRYDTYSRGLLAYAQGDFPKAVEFLGHAIAKDPDGYLWSRTTRAQAFVAMKQYDSALTEMEALRAALDQRDAKVVAVYESRELLDYSIGLLESARGRAGPARESLGRALVENPGFYGAHLMLGDDAYAARNDSGAIREYEAALLVEQGDAVLELHYGRSLARSGRLPDAVIALTKAVELEPYYAAPWLELARALERTQNRPGARAAYTTFIERSPRTDEANVSAARWALAALKPSGQP